MITIRVMILNYRWASRPCAAARRYARKHEKDACASGAEGGAPVVAARPCGSVRTRGVAGQYACEHEDGSVGAAGTLEAEDEVEGGEWVRKRPRSRDK